MIAKIIFGMSTKNSIFYNEEKVKQGKAIELIPFKTVVPTNQIKDKIELMDIYSNKNENVKNNSTHIVLSFTAEDKQEKVDFRNIAQDYLNELGYGQQPAYLYYHNDTANPHTLSFQQLFHKSTFQSHNTGFLLHFLYLTNWLLYHRWPLGKTGNRLGFRFWPLSSKHKYFL